MPRKRFVRNSRSTTRLSARDFQKKKRSGEPIVVLTAYDFFTARMIEAAELDAILVGDSLAMVALGHANTLPVTLDEMIHHSKAVRRGAPQMFLIGDIPYESCKGSSRELLHAAERFLEEGGCNAVKVEGAEKLELEAIRLMRTKKIEVMGHLGLTPQLLSRNGKPLKVQGKDTVSAGRITQEAGTLESLGVFSVVLECIPGALAEKITHQIRIPTVGIGAGVGCNGQVLVTDDLLGRYHGRQPKFVKRYLDSSRLTLEALTQFKKDVEGRRFPTQEHTFR
jgi:3-methyl-2-oxobutanoate hydroxymethyltransferase